MIRPSALGDVCRSVPVLASLRAAWPDARIDWIVQDGFEDAIRVHPMLDGIVRFPRKHFAGWWRKPSVARDIARWARSLRQSRYDMVFDFQGLGRSGLMAWATRSRRRIGLRNAREFAWLFYTHRHPPSPRPHTVDEMLWLLECEGVTPVRDMRLYVHDDDAVWWNQRQRELGIDGPYAVLAPTSRWASKRWPIDLWSELLAPLAKRGIKHAVVIGAPSEQAQVRDLTEHHEVNDLVGASSVGQTMAVIRGAALVVANDSAPLHFAVGFDRPAIGLFGPTNPERVGPYQRNRSVIQAELHEPIERIKFRDEKLGDTIMRRISPAMVLERIDEVLAAREHDGVQKGGAMHEQLNGKAAGMDAAPQTERAPATSRRL